ncbi:hypothetical protein [Diatraea saccharalis granulovirus]|uniref:Uncharacterized protein n=1 Tax=Diatraea saccharalis granulovirus TaxID=1675862 RepID=A0A0R7EYZ8_9BBAC|nr:hypothetical protein [Diatraea saccharalis granulovirus]AKN80811.1 hypothetical protein [Diatraea saccharalis granulovirus]
MYRLILELIVLSGKFEAYNYYGIKIHKQNVEENVHFIKYWSRKSNPYLRGMYKSYKWILESIIDDEVRKEFMQLFDEGDESAINSFFERYDDREVLMCAILDEINKIKLSTDFY